MSNEFKQPRDAFTFSLRGMKTIAPFAAPAAIADDEIDRRRADRPQQAGDGSAFKWQFWRRLRRQPA